MTQQAPVLRPLGAGDLIDETIDLYRSNFLTFSGIAAVLMVPAMLLVYLASAAVAPALAAALSAILGELPAQVGSLEEAASTIASAALLLLIGAPATLVSSAALTQAVADAYTGERPTISGSYERIMRRLLPLVTTVLSSYVPLICVSAAFLVVAGAIGIGAAGLAAAVGLAALAPAVLALVLLAAAYLAAVLAIAVWIALVPPAFIVEDIRNFGALRRAWRLARSRFWAILGVLLLTQLAASIIAGPFQFLAYALQERGMILGTLGGALYGLSVGLTTPACLVPTVLLYFDARVRLEGYDVEVLAREIGQGSAPSAEGV